MNKKIYNVGRIPGFDDGIWRYQCDVGLWRRIEINGIGFRGGDMSVLPKMLQPVKDWDGVLEEDQVGSYYRSAGKVNVYVDFKQK